MNTTRKRAVAVTTTLSIGALAGAASMSTSMQVLTMNTLTPSPAPGAITLASGKAVIPDHVLRIEEDRSRPLRAEEPMKFNTWLDDQPVVIRHHVPMYASCRVLAEWGMSGLAAFVRPNGMVAMVVDIADGAKLTVTETDTGPSVRKYVPFPTGSVAGERTAAQPADMAEEV